ncbi:MAG: hypothetical protein CV087_01705 [Candidatus Brocadia sp. WS118]|nr:MAG: hypothetical protein CV087_01705 [Candidatus Brocadia sp. WS118]
MKTLELPKPAPDLKAYDRKLSAGFQKYPERHENFLKYKKSSRCAKIDYMPIKLDIENVSRCNLKCDMCQVSSWESLKRGADMTFEDFKRILDEQFGLIELKIQGMGEPFLGKDFIRMVEYASRKNIWVRTSTNATVLDRKENYKRIIDAGIDEVQISVDGTTKDTYERIRGNADFEVMMKNCKRINRHCDSLEIDKTRMWVLLQKDNRKELHHFPAFARELGFKRVAIILDVHGWGNDQLTDKNTQKKVAYLGEEDVEKLLENARDLGINVTFWDISDKYSQTNLCPWPFERAYISSDKKVVPCCMIANPDTFNFGILDNTFEDIWNSQRYVQFRQAHLSGKVPGVCKYCYR